MPQANLVEDDTLPELSDTLDTAESASGASATLYVQQAGSTSMIVNAGSGDIDDDAAGATVVSYQFSASESANTGTHPYRWVITYADGDVESFPKDGFWYVEFDATLNRGGTVVTPETSGRAGPIDVLLLNEQGSAPGAPAVDDWGLYVDTNGDLQKLDENGSVTNIGAPDVSNDGSVVNTTPTDLNFASGIDASDDGDDTVSMSANESEIDHDALLNFVANEHVDHSNVDITAGDGLKGGGDLTATRTLDIEPDDFAGTGLEDDGSDDLQIANGRGVWNRSDVTATTHTATPWESAWVNTTAAGADVAVTLPPDGDLSDADRAEVGVEEASHNVTAQPNTGQSIIGANATLNTVGDTLSMEYKSDTSTWMVR